MNYSTIASSNILKDWLRPEYIEDFECGVLHKRWCHEVPFKYAVLPNLFLSSIIQSITEYCHTIPVTKARIEGISSHTNWYWGAFNYLEVVKFIYSKHFQSFLFELLGERLIMKASLIPQYNVFQASSQGIPIHTDYGRPVNFVSLLQLSKQHKPNWGGELIFYREEQGKLVAFESIIPQSNTFIIFKVCPNSYHSVSDLQQYWIRENIAFDWCVTP
ncbi:hypothetical protein LC608_31355 [Nostoc sp. XA010]|uniref:2OG-Fe(II) oxygenase family protein n=1 Tax=Nostoc sp. XA010 TaxID=2780407 RepID=UPI001E53058B|nr:2OG-Fe(II) oxygenase family protein [Nostoc sp. XA010]MCC5661373.1 hypothetical protein [Nostoc sp. XA010]